MSDRRHGIYRSVSRRGTVVPKAMIGRALTANEAAALLDGSGDRFTASTWFRQRHHGRKCIAVAPNTIAKITKGAPIDRHQSKDEAQAPPTEPGFDGKNDAAMRNNAVRAVKAQQ